VITDIIRGYNCRLASILSTYEKAPEGHRHVFIRAFNVDRETLPKLIAELRETANMLYFVDHRDDVRQIF